MSSLLLRLLPAATPLSQKDSATSSGLLGSTITALPSIVLLHDSSFLPNCTCMFVNGVSDSKPNSNSNSKSNSESNSRFPDYLALFPSLSYCSSHKHKHKKRIFGLWF